MATQWTARQRPAESRTRGRARLASTDKTVVNAIKRSRLKYCKLHRPYQPPHRINVINVGSLSQYTLFTFWSALDFKLPKLEAADNDMKLGLYRAVYLANYLRNICVLRTDTFYTYVYHSRNPVMIYFFRLTTIIDFIIIGSYLRLLENIWRWPRLAYYNVNVLTSCSCIT